MNAKNSSTHKQKTMEISPAIRAVFGFVLGLVLMSAVLQVFQPNRFDFDNIRTGTLAIWSGVNPWNAETRITHFYNPPFAALFLWPTFFTSPRILITLGAALLVAYIFYYKTWLGLAWFATNSALGTIVAGNVDMFVMGSGLLLLLAGDHDSHRWRGMVWRILAYGFLLVKPQGGLFIVILYVLLRRDWIGIGIAGLLYSALSLPYLPDWIHVLLTDPPPGGFDVPQSLWGAFGPFFALVIMPVIVLARRWKYWQLGAALAAILPPYAMGGVPIILLLTTINSWKAAIAILIYSGCMALLTWIEPPFPVPDYYDFIDPLLTIYNFSLIGLTFILSLLLPDPRPPDDETIDLRPRAIQIGQKMKGILKR